MGKIKTGFDSDFLWGGAMLIYLRSVLWLCLVGGLMMFFGALLGFRYV